MSGDTNTTGEEIITEKSNTTNSSLNETAENITDTSVVTDPEDSELKLKKRRGRPRKNNRDKNYLQNNEDKEKEEVVKKMAKTQLDLHNHAEQIKLVKQQCVVAEGQHAALQRKLMSTGQAPFVQQPLVLQPIPSNLIFQQLQQQLQQLQERQNAIESSTLLQQPPTVDENSTIQNNNVLQQILDKITEMEKKQEIIEKKLEINQAPPSSLTSTTKVSTSYNSKPTASETNGPPLQKPLKELSRLCLGANNNSQNNVVTTSVCTETRVGLPLLQVWPSDSPRGEGDGQSQAFIFPDVQENVNDSGIESIQASPSPCGVTCVSPATTPQQSRRPSLLHPDHARLHSHHSHHNHHSSGSKNSPSPDRHFLDDDVQPVPPSPSSSTTSSLRSMPSSAMCSASIHSADRRRSSRYSMFDALDLEYALLRAAARGSVGPYSLSESLHKLTFTQSLAFPALARGLASKQSVPSRRPQQHVESGMNAFAKVVTALVLMLVSVLVFGVVYKFVRT